MVWGDDPHSELGFCFQDIGADPMNRIVILTGTGDDFIAQLDDSWVGEMTPAKWSHIYANAVRLLTAFLDIEVPVIAAVNGPARIHAELPLLADIVLSSDSAFYQDAPHFRYGTVPSDGAHVVWPLLLGVNRARYFLLTSQKIPAHEALELGLVGEVVPADALSARAWELAHELARQPDTTLRYTRAAITQRLRRLLQEQLRYGLALEGLGAHDTWPT
jgi:enoyl-CoA hydratase/carnithine racemase